MIVQKKSISNELAAREWDRIVKGILHITQEGKLEPKAKTVNDVSKISKRLSKDKVKNLISVGTERRLAEERMQTSVEATKSRLAVCQALSRYRRR